MNLRYLTVYHEITKNPLMRILSEMLEKAPEEAEGDASRLIALLVEQSEKYLLEGPVLEAWAWHCLLGDVNAFSMNCERHWEVGRDSSLYKAVQRGHPYPAGSAAGEPESASALWFGGLRAAVLPMRQEKSGFLSGGKESRGVEADVRRT